MISNERVQEFKILYKNRFGKELSDGEAREKASALVHFLKIIYKPMTKRSLMNWRKGTPLYRLSLFNSHPE